MKENIEKVRSKIKAACEAVGRDPNSVTILAATKMVSAEKINKLHENGIFCAGENRVQELLSKVERVEKISWHFIGSLQTNKVKYIIDKVDLIHSVDRINLVDEIEKKCFNINRVVDVLIEINACGEKSKSGVRVEEIEKLYLYIKSKSKLNLKGFMPVLPIEAKESVYQKMQDIFNHYKKMDSSIDTLSMGMSDDFETAIRYGATIVRLGSILFGERNY